MTPLFRTLSLAPRGIRYKLTVAFALMSIIPMLVCGYLIVHYIFPTIKTTGDVSLVFAITMFLIVMGFYLAKKIIYPIVQITAHAKGIVEGRLEEHLEIKGEDEIGELSFSLNRLSSRLKDNMTELHSYGEKIKQINMEINKKVFALSSLLQIGNLITTVNNLDEVFNLIVEKLAQLETGGAAFLMLQEKNTGELKMRAQANITSEQARQKRIKMGRGLLGTLATTAQPVIVDAKKGPKVVDKELKAILETKNLILLPVTSSGKVVGIVGTGNNIEGFSFSDDQVELIGVFAKQVAVALENDMLLRKTEELTVSDELTGLYNENYIRGCLDEEIRRSIAYQRPCSFMIFELNNLKEYRDALGEIPAEKAIKRIARTLKEGTTEIDKVARFSDHQFAIVVPEKNKAQSVNIAKNINKEIERFTERLDKLSPGVRLSVCVGISATPIDGATSTEVINRALQYTGKAKAEGKKNIVTS